MDSNKQLEELSDKVRRGEAVDFWEAIAVIDYQNGLREEREAAKARAWWRRAWRWLAERAKGVGNDHG